MTTRLRIATGCLAIGAGLCSGFFWQKTRVHAETAAVQPLDSVQAVLPQITAKPNSNEMKPGAISPSDISRYSVLRDRYEIAGLVADLQRAPASPRRSEALDALYHSWGRTEPLAALRSLKSEPPGTQSKFQKSILSGWAESDPAAAWRWLEANLPLEAANSMPERSARWEQYATVITTLLQNDQPGFLKSLVENSASNAVQAQVAYALAQYFATNDLVAGIALLNTFPPGATRTSLLSTITDSIAHEAPDVAAQFALGFADPATRAKTLKTAFMQWAAQDDLTAALQWIAQQKDPENIAPALEGFVFKAEKADPQLIARLLNENSYLPNRPRMIEGAVRLASLASPERALTLITSLENDSDRPSQLEMVITQWRNRSSSTDSLRQIITNQAGLDASEKETLIKILTSSAH